MNDITTILTSFSDNLFTILDGNLSISKYIFIDLSEKNAKLNGIDLTNYLNCQHYIDSVLKKNSAVIAYGGYLEKRNLYRGNLSFENEGSRRNVHLGMDFWAPTGTKVITPVNGRVHSFKNNSNMGDYGPTIILEHEINGFKFHTLYGHLSIESLDGLHVGKPFKREETLATLGAPEINVGYAPHLHFQVIKDLQGMTGDYPGVCAEKDVEFYSKNCPDPNLLLKID